MTSSQNLTVTGIDLGSSAVKIAAVLKGGVQVITNQANFRQTPNVVGFFQNQRLLGESGQVKIKSNHSNTVTAPSRFLGFNRSCKYLSEELKFCPARIKKSENQEQNVKFNVSYCNERQNFTSQQLVGSLITQTQKIISQTNSLMNKNMVIAVPSYFSQHERKALLNAIQIAKKKVNNQYSTQLVNQQAAISMDYGFSKKNQFSEELQKSKKILFIDFGHSKTNLFVTAFNKQHMRILANNFSRQLGCKFLDQQILNFYATKFDQSHSNMQLNLLQSKKAILKLLENIEKQRKVLSGNSQHDLSIQCLLEDQDFHYTMKRDQYQKICSPIIEKFKSLLVQFLNQLKQKGINIDSIQLIGGGTRIPIIISKIGQVFGFEPSRTINSNQCVARGAALISAMNSSIFKVQTYNFFTLSPYSVQIRINNEILDKKLIQKNELLLKQKSIEFEVDQSMKKLSLLAEYENSSLQEGLQNRIFSFDVIIETKKKIKEESLQTEMKQQSQENMKTKLKLTISINENGLVIFDKFISENSEVSLKLGNIQTFQKYFKQEIFEMEEKEKQMTLNDFQIKKIYQKKNEYQSLIYKRKHEVSQFISQNSDYISSNKSAEISQMFQNEENWVTSNLQLNKQLKIQEFAQRNQHIIKKTEEFVNSINQLKQLHVIVNAEIQKLANFLNQIIQKRSQDMYPQQVNKVGQWINQIFQKQKNSAKYNIPVVTLQELRQVYQDIAQKVNEFDKEIERQRHSNLKKSKFNPSQRQPQYHRQPQSTYNPYSGYMGRSHQDDYYRPRTTRNNRGGYQNNSNPFGSSFGSGFSGFF